MGKKSVAEKGNLKVMNVAGKLATKTEYHLVNKREPRGVCQ
jgi:hypothetical protein